MINMKATAARRPYKMVARAHKRAAATRERILDAAVELFWDSPAEPVALEDVAGRAGVTVQTVIRRFGGREGLFARAAAEREMTRTRSQRDEAPVGDASGAVRLLLDHYEAMGDRVGRLLAEEQRSIRGARGGRGTVVCSTASGASGCSHPRSRASRAASGGDGWRSS